MSQLTIVVVTYRVHEYLTRCLEAIADLGHDVIVVDNSPRELSSTDDLRAQWPGVTFIERPENRGYGAAANLGADLARGRHVLLLNSDAWPVGDAIESLLRHGEAHPQAAAVGPRLVRPDGTLQRSVFSTPPGPLSLALWTLSPHLVSWAWARLQRLRATRAKAVAKDCLEVAHERDVSPGFSAAPSTRRNEGSRWVRRDLLPVQRGGRYLLRRLREQGWKIHFVPTTTFVHVGGASTQLDGDGTYQTLLLSHLRLLAKYQGIRAASALVG